MDLSGLFAPLRFLNNVLGISNQSKGMDTSIPVRQWVASRLNFTNGSSKSEILDPKVTKTELIAALEFLIKKGWHIGITALVKTHHFDGTGNGFHNSAGAAADFWLYTDSKMNTWVDASTQTFRNFLKDCADAPKRMQVGLGGTAWSDANVKATGLSLDTAAVFMDSPTQDHIHLGVVFQ